MEANLIGVLGNIKHLWIQWGLRGLQPHLIFHKIMVIRVPVVIDVGPLTVLVVTSSNDACLCALNGVAV